MNPPVVRRAVAVLAALAAVLGLSGCFKANQDMEIRSDGTGSVLLHVEVNKKALEAVARSFGDLGSAVAPMEEPFKPVDKTFPDGTKVRAVNGPDRSTVDASFDFNGSDDYNRKLQQVGEAVSTDPDDGLTPDGSIQVRRIGDRMEVTLDVGSATQDTEDLDLSALEGVLDPSALPSVVFTITMPGSIVTTNGQQRGRTVSWDLLSKTAPPTLTVTSKVEKDGLPAWAIPAGGGLILLMLLAILGVLLVQRRRTAKTAGPAVPYRPVPWQPGEGASGPGTFFPPSPGPPPGPPPHVPVGWSPPPPPSGSAPPPSGPQPSGTLGWPPTPGPVPEPSQEPPGWSSPPAPAAPAPTSPWAPAPAPPEAPPAHAPDPELPADEPLPWRVPGATAEPTVAAPPQPEPEPEPEPAAPATPTVEPGWYADPAGGSGARYWDGHQWTEHTR